MKSDTTSSNWVTLITTVLALVTVALVTAWAGPGAESGAPLGSQQPASGALSVQVPLSGTTQAASTALQGAVSNAQSTGSSGLGANPTPSLNSSANGSSGVTSDQLMTGQPISNSGQ